jgi:hypothetical protein
MHVKERYVIFIHLFDPGILLIIDLNKKKGIKKNHSMYTGVLDYFNEKLILDYYFCLKSGPVFLFQIFIIILYSESKYSFHNPLPPPKGYSIVSLIIN